MVGVAGDVKVRRHRSLPCKPTSAILSRQAGTCLDPERRGAARPERIAATSHSQENRIDPADRLADAKSVAFPGVLSWKAVAFLRRRPRLRALAHSDAQIPIRNDYSAVFR